MACSLCRNGRVFDSKRLARAIFSCYAPFALGIYGTAIDGKVGSVCIDSTVILTLDIECTSAGNGSRPINSQCCCQIVGANDFNRQVNDFRIDGISGIYLYCSILKCKYFVGRVVLYGTAYAVYHREVGAVGRCYLYAGNIDGVGGSAAATTYVATCSSGYVGIVVVVLHLPVFGGSVRLVGGNDGSIVRRRRVVYRLYSYIVRRLPNRQSTEDIVECCGREVVAVAI